MAKELKNIFETINAVMQDVSAIGKNSKNQSQGFMFRGIDDVMNELNPAMKCHKLFVAPEVLEQQRYERTNSKGSVINYSLLKIKFTFYAEDGSNISVITLGEGMDSGDKASNKAMSIALKYALFQLFMIPTEEMKQADPDKESHELVPETAEQAYERLANTAKNKAELKTLYSKLNTTLKSELKNAIIALGNSLPE